MNKKYFTEEERLAAKRASDAKRYQENRDKILAKNAERYQKNRDEILAQRAEYNSTPYGRAKYLLGRYRQSDIEHNRGECTLSAEWIIENIFSKPCAHCGKEGWRVVGCNRLDNSKPHTPDNVEPCCKKCNDMLASYEKSKTVYQYTLDGLLVAIWPSTRECGKNGYDPSTVVKCCRGIKHYNTHKGYRWSYKPLNKVCQLEFNFK